MDPQVGEPDRRLQLVGDEVAGRLRDEDLAAVAGRADPGRPVDVESDVALGRGPRLARVEAHPVADRDPAGPLVAGDRELAVDRPPGPPSRAVGKTK